MGWFDIIKRSAPPYFARPKGETLSSRNPRHSGYRQQKNRPLGHFEREGIKNLQRENRKRHLDRTGKKSTTDMLDYQFRDMEDDNYRAEKDAIESNVQAQPTDPETNTTMGNFTNYPEQALPLEQRFSAFNSNPQVAPWTTE